ncbi:MAG: LPS-assembly protein LptD [Elusimicrobia bacterium]|nr:LPS-assembly protein LptD [Elusimicrobiota bacterium]
MKTLFFSFLIFLPVAYGQSPSWNIFPSTETSRVRFSCEKVEFSDTDRSFRLKEKVVIDAMSTDNSIERRITSNEVQIYTSSKVIHSPGSLEMLDRQGNLVSGEWGFFDYDKNTGSIRNGRLDSDNFIFTGRRIEVTKDRYVYRKARITACDFLSPHYKIKSSKMILEPGRKFTAYNNLFYVGKIPVFYFPVIYKPLGSDAPFVTTIRPGYDDRNGFYVKTTLSRRFSPELGGKLFLDYFSKKGFGTGAEIDHHKQDDRRINLSIYSIKESGLPGYRWGLSGGQWQKLGTLPRNSDVNYYLQSYFRLMSDPGFNNDFFRSNPFAVSPDKQANGAIVRNSNFTVTRITFYKDYRITPDRSGFYKSAEAAPRIDFQTIPLKFPGLPFLNTFNAYFESLSRADVPWREKTGKTNWTVSYNYPVSKRITLYPALFYEESVFISTSPYTDTAWTGRYGTRINLRWSKLWGSFDMGYSIRKRLEIGRFRDDVSDPDKGIEEETLSHETFIRPSGKIFVRARTSYDLKEYPAMSFAERFSPITLDVSYAPSSNLNLYVQDVYDIASGNESFISQVMTGDDENYFGLGISNYAAVRREYLFHQTFGIKPGKISWRMEAILRYKMQIEDDMDFKGLSFFEKSLLLYKDFHDFRTKWRLTFRPGVKEFFFMVNLKINDRQRRSAIGAESDGFWHPWRKEDEERD